MKLALALTVVAACGSSHAPAPTVPAKPDAPALTSVDPAASLEIASEEITSQASCSSRQVRGR